MTNLQLKRMELEREIELLLEQFPQLKDDQDLLADMLEGQTDFNEVIASLAKDIKMAKANAAGIKELTKELVYAGSIMHIKILDHVIIGNDQYFSFAGEGLIEEYELDFLNLKMRGVTEVKRNIYRTASTPELPWNQ